MPNAKKAYISDGINWLPLVSGTPDLTGYATTEYVDEFTPSISISSNPPASPGEGQLWFDTDTNELFMYDSVYWVEISGAPTDYSEYLTASSASTIYATQTDLDNIDALPSQTGNDGKYLTTSGSVASWGILDLSLYATSASIPGIIEQNTVHPFLLMGG
jgi:hypothetical protein